MADWILFLRALAASQALLLSIALLWPRPMRQRAGPLCAAGLSLAIAAYLLAPLMPTLIGAAGTRLLAVFAGLIPLLLLFFVWVVFEDRSLRQRGLWLVAAVYSMLLVWGTLDLLGAPACRDAVGCPVRHAAWVLQASKMALCIAAVVLLLRGSSADLDAVRRRWRQRMALLLCAAIGAVVMVELVFRWSVVPGLELLGMALFAVGLLCLNLLLIGDRFSEVVVPDLPGGEPADVEAASEASAQPIDPRVARLESAMTDQRLYADHDLRIGDLAAQLSLREHQLRRLINQQLGHRNFNRFINGYRVREAQQRLLAEPELPVLTIALEVGFRSMSAFNAAFRVESGQTPTAWRARNLSEFE